LRFMPKQASKEGLGKMDFEVMLQERQDVTWVTWGPRYSERTETEAGPQLCRPAWKGAGERHRLRAESKVPPNRPMAPRETTGA